MAFTSENPPSESAVAFMKSSFRYSSLVDKLIEEDEEFRAMYQQLLAGFARNAKTQPGGFKATSGVVLRYYLNLSTNFMDTEISPIVVKCITKLLLKLYDEIVALGDFELQEGDKVIVVGMEVAGGMMVSQFAAAGHPELNNKFDFVYMRKERKKSGTVQQLEGPKKITERTPESTPIKAVWIDDVNSTGSSLYDGIMTLQTDYNMHVTHAVYLVDRSADRASLVPERSWYCLPRYFSESGGPVQTRVCALMDLEEVDKLIP